MPGKNIHQLLTDPLAQELQMARIEIEPQWVKLLDFETRVPSAFEEGG